MKELLCGYVVNVGSLYYVIGSFQPHLSSTNCC